MANFDMNFKVDVAGVEKFKALIELLSKYNESLPGEIVSALSEIADNEVFEYDADWFHDRAFDKEIKVYIDGEVSELPVSSVNFLLKKVKHNVVKGEFYEAQGDELVIGEIYPKALKITAGDNVLVQW